MAGAVVTEPPPQPYGIVTQENQKLAERVGFVPGDPAAIIGLGQIGGARTAQILEGAVDPGIR
jgi:hypothetical protein